MPRGVDHRFVGTNRVNSAPTLQSRAEILETSGGMVHEVLSGNTPSQALVPARPGAAKLPRTSDGCRRVRPRGGGARGALAQAPRWGALARACCRLRYSIGSVSLA